MKVYLLKVCAYRKGCQDLCDVWNYEALLFDNLKSAVSKGKQILKKQIKELYDTDPHKSVYKFLEEYIEGYEGVEPGGIGYIFEVEETDPSKYKDYSFIAEEEFDITNPYREMEKVIKNPLYVTWEYDYKGKLIDRSYYAVETGKVKSLSGGERGNVGYSYRPYDEKKGVGKKFALGDVVIEKKNKQNKKLYFVTMCPLFEYKYFANDYRCGFLREDSVFDLTDHEHFHEEDIQLYQGDIPANLKWISDFFKGKIELNPEDEEKFWRGEYSFADKPSYTSIRKTIKQ